MNQVSGKPCVAIVDGYSTGRDLAREFLERNVACLHVQSALHPSDTDTSFDPFMYAADLGYLGPPAAAAEVLATLAPIGVVAGSDHGVEHAEQISRALGLPTHSAQTALARRDKHRMIEAARCKGLATPDQAMASNPGEALEWAQHHGKWPIVVKPTASTDADGVTICYDARDIAHAFEKAHRRRNRLGTMNELLLLQSFLSGRQLVVNTVSVGGSHYVTDAWHMTFSPLAAAAIVPKELTLLDPSGQQGDRAFAFTRQVLDALGIENGAAHTEIKWTRNGPALIETGAHLMPVSMHRGAHCCADLPTQAGVLANSLTTPGEDWCRAFGNKHYRLRKHMTKLFFSFDDAGIVRSVAGLARLRKLPSFQAHVQPLAPGDRVWRTQDTLGCGGIVHLVHEDAEQIAHDVQTIREWESGGELYDIDTGSQPEALLPRALQTGWRSQIAR